MKFISKCMILLHMFIFGHGNYDTFSSRKLLTDWCSLKCGNTPNTACGKCKYQNPCKEYTINKEEILEIHNERRNQFAAGEDKRAGDIQIANMNAISWDEDLAYTASCHVAQCVGMKHDTCRITPNFPSAGQNLFASSSTNKNKGCTGIETAGVRSWYGEIKLLTPEEIKATGAAFRLHEGAGHFTQVLWADVTHVGCAIASDEYSGGVKCYLTCNYGPSGNVNHRSMFKEGKPCSQCAVGLSCGTTYKNLCGDVQEINRMTHVYPNRALIIILLLLAYKSFIL